MENLFRKKLVAAMLAFMITAGALPLAVDAQTATSTMPVGGKQCASWGLYWTIDDAANNIIKNTRVTQDPRTTSPFIPNPVAAGDEGSTETNPPSFPYHNIPTTDAQWACESYTTTPLASARTDAEKAAPAGMELCAQAAKLAAKFGSFTALDLNFSEKIQTTVLNKVVGFLSDTVKEKTNIDISNIQKSAFDAAGNFLTGQFDSLIKNPMKDEINNQITKIENEAKQKLQQVGQKALSNIAGNAGKAIGKAIGSAIPIPGVGDLLSSGGGPDPVIDQDVLDQLKAMEKKQDQQVAEQKIAEANADTRAKCAELLKTTNETIKKALLYQLSTQIVDWVQTGKTPQFIKQPGKFLEDTGRLALDRFISRVAPRLCEPFRLSVQLQIPSVRRQDNPFYEQITCSLDRVVANVNSFYRDFRQGGWIGYQEILKPQNNYYGASLAMMDEAMKQQAAAQYAAQQEQARGFSAVKQCTEWARFDPYAGPMSSVLDIRDDGSGNYFLRAPNASPEATGGTGPIDADGKVVSGLTKEPQTGRIEKGVRFWKNMYSIGNSYFWECEVDIITQPATVSASLTEKASQMDLDNLAASQDVSMFLQTIEDSIINKLTKAGVKGLQGLLKGLPISP